MSDHLETIDSIPRHERDIGRNLKQCIDLFDTDRAQHLVDLFDADRAKHLTDLFGAD